jgi:hypothetical protein
MELKLLKQRVVTNKLKCQQVQMILHPLMILPYLMSSTKLLLLLINQATLLLRKVEQKQRMNCESCCEKTMLWYLVKVGAHIRKGW